ncbi:MAG: hypothetical protein PHT07_23040 [Paludibacter sp.]|nr:hypothetical protein [Paludibacter sp.]
MTVEQPPKFCLYYNVPLSWFRDDGYRPACYPEECTECTHLSDGRIPNGVKNVG